MTMRHGSPRVETCHASGASAARDEADALAVPPEAQLGIGQGGGRGRPEAQEEGKGPESPEGRRPEGTRCPRCPPYPPRCGLTPEHLLGFRSGPTGPFLWPPWGLGPLGAAPPWGSWRPPQGLLCPPEGRGPHVRPQAGGLQGNGEKKRWIPAACAQEAIGLYSLPCSALGGGAFTLLHPLGAPPSATSGDGGTFKRRGTSEEAPFRFPAGHGSQSQSRGLRPAGSVSEPPRLAAPARSTPRPRRAASALAVASCGIRSRPLPAPSALKRMRLAASAPRLPLHGPGPVPPPFEGGACLARPECYGPKTTARHGAGPSGKAGICLNPFPCGPARY